MPTGTWCVIGTAVLACGFGEPHAQELRGAVRQTFQHATEDDGFRTDTCRQDYRVELRITQRLSWQERESTRGHAPWTRPDLLAIDRPVRGTTIARDPGA